MRNGSHFSEEKLATILCLTVSAVPPDLLTHSGLATAVPMQRLQSAIRIAEPLFRIFPSQSNPGDRIRYPGFHPDVVFFNPRLKR